MVEPLRRSGKPFVAVLFLVIGTLIPSSRVWAASIQAPSDTPQTGTIKSARANIRSAPSLDGHIVVTLPQGTALQIDQEENGWLHISATSPAGAAITGWISAGLVNRDAPTVAQAPIHVPPPQPIAAPRPEPPPISPPPLSRSAIARAASNIPSQDEQLWLQDVNRAKRTIQNSKRLMLLGAGSVVVGVLLHAQEQSGGGYEYVSEEGFSTVTLAIVGGLGVAGYGYYTYNKSETDLKTLLQEGQQKGFSAQLGRGTAAIRFAMSF